MKVNFDVDLDSLALPRCVYVKASDEEITSPMYTSVGIPIWKIPETILALLCDDFKEDLLAKRKELKEKYRE